MFFLTPLYKASLLITTSRNALEISVQNMRVENEQLRKRLAALRSGRQDEPPSSSVPDADTAVDVSSTASTGIGIDYAYLAKIQTELSASKTILLDKQLELARLNGVEADEEKDAFRNVILSQNTKLAMLQAESTSLISTSDLLHSERQELAKETSLVRNEVEKRSKDSVKVQKSMENQHSDIDKALLDVSWME